MAGKRVFAFIGHPGPKSLCASLVSAYLDGVKEGGHEVRSLNLAAMNFDPNLEGGHCQTAAPLEADLRAFWDNLQWCEHFVLGHPLWWGGFPARLKGVFDRALLPGAAYDPSSKWPLPKPLLKGRSARVLITADTSGFFLRLAYGNAILKQTDRQVFRICGIRPNRFSVFSPVKRSTDEKRRSWLNTARALGRKDV